MAFPMSHKTVVVLDQSDHFLYTHSDQSFEFDLINKTRQPSGIIPLAPITKSLWTCTSEAIAEYCRIVWDVFPNGERLIRFVAFDNDSAHFINTWNSETQNLASAMESFAKSTSLVHMKRKAKDKSSDKMAVMNGLKKAIEALSECSEMQTEKRRSANDSSSSSALLNRGRIICISSFRNDSHIRSVEECFVEALYVHNKYIASAAAHSDQSLKMQINFCEIIFINTFASDDHSLPKVAEVPRHEISPLVLSETFCVKTGRFLAAKLGYLLLPHYDLASTTVTGIPMKEEQNSSSSANYDVEIVHPAAAHTDIFKSGYTNVEGVCVTTMRESYPYDTITLKWCTPRTNVAELHYCTSAYRITSVDVNSRPSSCLTNFLLSGRTVMLEMPRSKGNKMMSHMLSSHNGELYIHTLGTGRSILEDPPSISEGSGGRVTDYRINDFGEFMKRNHLVQCRYLQTGIKDVPFPIEKAKHSMIRQTLYWPLVIGHTILLNMLTSHAHIEKLIQLIPKESLTADDVLECNKSIYHLLTLETKGNTLPIPTIGTRGKGPKREELYKMLWNELEYFLRAYCSSVQHSSVLNCLLSCRSKPENQSPTNSNRTANVDDESNVKKQMNGANKSEHEWAWKELTEWAQNEMESLDDDKNDRPEPNAKKLRSSTIEPKMSHFKSSGGPQSLLQLWTTKLNDDNSRKRSEFIGRTSANGSVAKLYVNLNDKNE